MWFIIIPGWIINGILIFLLATGWYVFENAINILFVLSILFTTLLFCIWNTYHLCKGESSSKKWLAFLALITLVFSSAVSLTIFSPTSFRDVLTMNLINSIIGTLSCFLTTKFFKHNWVGVIILILCNVFVFSLFASYLENEKKQNEEFINEYMDRVNDAHSNGTE